GHRQLLCDSAGLENPSGFQFDNRVRKRVADRGPEQRPHRPQVSQRGDSDRPARVVDLVWGLEFQLLPHYGHRPHQVSEPSNRSRPVPLLMALSPLSRCWPLLRGYARHLPDLPRLLEATQAGDHLAAQLLPLIHDELRTGKLSRSTPAKIPTSAL